MCLRPRHLRQPDAAGARLYRVRARWRRDAGVADRWTAGAVPGRRVFSPQTAREMRTMLEMAVQARRHRTARRRSPAIAWPARRAPRTSCENGALRKQIRRLLCRFCTGERSAAGSRGHDRRAELQAILRRSGRRAGVFPGDERCAAHALGTARRADRAASGRSQGRCLARRAGVDVSAPAAIALLDQLKKSGVVPKGATADSRQVAPGRRVSRLPGSRHRRPALSSRTPSTRAPARCYGTQPNPLISPRRPRPVSRCCGRRVARARRPSGRSDLHGAVGHVMDRRCHRHQWQDDGQPVAGACAVEPRLQVRRDRNAGKRVSRPVGNGLHTTPDAPALHKRLAEFREAGAVAASMEVSSIGLHQGRVNGVRFDVAIFTNLTRDHLDYHGDMASLCRSQGGSFRMNVGKAVINVDDRFGAALARRTAGRNEPVHRLYARSRQPGDRAWRA